LTGSHREFADVVRTPARFSSGSGGFPRARSRQAASHAAFSVRLRQRIVKFHRVEDVADPLLKNAFPFKTLESLSGPARRTAAGVQNGPGKFFGSLREVSVCGLLDLAGLRSGLIGNPPARELSLVSHRIKKLSPFARGSAGAGEDPILSLAVDREGKDK
jgi:hypothetical protein